MKEMDRVLQLKEEGHLLSYDTTFNLDYFYVSLLIFRNVIFKENPCIPVAFLIHENKQKDTHEAFFSFISENPLQKYYVQFICISCAVCKHLLIVTAIYVQFSSIGLHTNCTHFVHMLEQICYLFATMLYANSLITFDIKILSLYCYYIVCKQFHNIRYQNLVTILLLYCMQTV